MDATCHHNDFSSLRLLLHRRFGTGGRGRRQGGGRVKRSAQPLPSPSPPTAVVVVVVVGRRKRRRSTAGRVGRVGRVGSGGRGGRGGGVGRGVQGIARFRRATLFFQVVIRDRQHIALATTQRVAQGRSFDAMGAQRH